MSLFLDSAYAPRLENRLKLFKRKNTYVWNFRCPICNDSDRNQHKARGYILRRKDSLYFYCHNCGTSMPFHKFLKNMDPMLHREYQLDSLKEMGRASDITSPEDFKAKTYNLQEQTEINLPSIESLPGDHFAKRFLLERRIPKNFFSDLYYADEFKGFVDEIQPDNGKELPTGDKRIIIPFRDWKGILQGFQGRAVSKSRAKYISILLDDDASKLYGMDRVNLKAPRIYIVEGPFDSMFLDNALAASDAQLYNVPFHIKAQGKEDIDDSKYVFIYDNEPRNTAIVRNIRKTIKMGHNVFIWPRQWSGVKDINDLIRLDHGSAEIMMMIDSRTFSGMNADLELAQWLI